MGAQQRNSRSYDYLWADEAVVFVFVGPVFRRAGHNLCDDLKLFCVVGGRGCLAAAGRDVDDASDDVE